MGREVVFQIERTVYAETLKWQGGSGLLKGGKGGSCAWACERWVVRLERWLEATSRRELEAVVTSLGSL